MDNQNAFNTDNLKYYISDGTLDSVISRYAALPEIAATSDFGQMDTDLVVLDTEATGISFKNDDLTQIAAARVENGKISDWFVTFVNPGQPIPDDIVHLTHITDEDVAGAPSPEEAVARLVDFIGNSKVVAHNVGFDKSMLTKHESGKPLEQNIWIDSLDLARIALPRMKSHRLIDLITAFGGPKSTHRADDDVAATCALLRILFAAVSQMPLPLVRKIAALCPPDVWNTQVVFEYFAGCSEDRTDFSLRSIRHERTRNLEVRAKEDADKIAADEYRSLNFPVRDQIHAAFTPQGMVGSIYPGFEPRAEQLEMSQAVNDAFSSSSNLAVEAGTGVGKSMAYLVPAVYAASMNNITVGVATKTNALLDQLIYSELPALKKAFAEKVPTAKPLTYAALKGFSHYPCLHRVEQLANEQPQLQLFEDEKPKAPSVAALLSYIEQTEYDDIDGLKIDYRSVPRRLITTTSHDCLRRKCPFYGTSCFVHGARRRAEQADIVVTNHSLLFCDLAADGGLLPPIRYWVVDEAHNAEAEARRAFALSVEAADLERVAKRLESEESSRNVFVRAERRISVGGGEERATLFFGLTSKARSLGRAYAQSALQFASVMRELDYFVPGKKNRGYDLAEIWLNTDVRQSAVFGLLASQGQDMIQKAERLVTATQELVAFLEDIENAAVIQREAASLAIDLKEQIKALDLILNQAPESYAYSATVSVKHERPAEKLEALPLDMSSTLNETLFANTHSVIFASATISVNNSFDAFKNSVGLDSSEFSRANTLQLNSSYDFDKNMTIYVVEDMPDPTAPSYLAALQKLLAQAHLANNGSLLTLFTNRKDMEACYKEVYPILKDADLRLVRQKWGVSAKGLRDDFLKDETLSLFALKSFWEGFDAPGSTLSGVIIPKLPFAKPTDPLYKERELHDAQAWSHYVLPGSVLEMKQAAGRLIRKADDTGFLILADHRLVSKGYGRVFLNSMPSRNIKTMRMNQIIEEIQEARASKTS